MKYQYDKHMSDRQIEKGARVWLKLQPYRQSLVQTRVNQKLSYKYFGPLQINEVVGKVAYELKLHDNSYEYNVFHVSHLKAFQGAFPSTAKIPSFFNDSTIGSTDLKPAAILYIRPLKNITRFKSNIMGSGEEFVTKFLLFSCLNSVA